MFLIRSVPKAWCDAKKMQIFDSKKENLLKKNLFKTVS